MGSLLSSSTCNSFEITAKYFSKSTASTEGSSITASVLRGMALSARPPSMVTRHRSPKSFFNSSKILAINRLEFILPLLISVPECPPIRPSTRIVYLHAEVSSSSRHTSMPKLTLLPPAQLTRKMPSSSESRFSILRPLMQSRSIPMAPSIPVSSSTVMITSSGGCSRESSSKSARA